MIERNLLIRRSICTIILLILGSLSNVVGYQTVRSVNQTIIENAVDQKELVFQTIGDIANNKEIQQIILKSQMSRGLFPVSKIPVFTKHQLKQMYFIGLMLSRFVGKSKIHSIVEKYQFRNEEMQKEINAVIEKNATLSAEFTELSNGKYDCENNYLLYWPFPVICSILLLFIFSFNVILLIVYRVTGIYYLDIYNKMVGSIGVFATLLNCSWI